MQKTLLKESRVIELIKNAGCAQGKFGELLLPLIFCITYMIMKKYYPGELVNIHTQLLINIIQ